MDEVTLTLAEAENLTARVLGNAGLRGEQAAAIVRTMVAAERDACRSHGMYRLIGLTHTIKTGLLRTDAVPVVSEPAPALIRVDAGQGPANLAFERGLPLLIEKTKRFGIAAMAINHCFHFNALWAEVEPLAEAGLAALSMTPSHSWVTPAGGTQPLFGTNPIAFGWPRPGKHPFVFDFATSAAARGEIELHRRAGKPIPLGWGVDEHGAPTTDAETALKGAMLTFGGHKGSALAAMVELLAGPLIGDFVSSESMAFDGGKGGFPYHGALIIALDPASFLGASIGDAFERAEQFFADYGRDGVRLPSSRRYEARAVSQQHGFTMPKKLHAELLALAA